MIKQGLQSFGGKWTEQKLEVLNKYMSAYACALKNQPFNLIYIDAFAGTGYRELKNDFDSNSLKLDLCDDETQGFLDGSARISLQVESPFDKYLFIEKDSSKCDV